MHYVTACAINQSVAAVHGPRTSAATRPAVVPPASITYSHKQATAAAIIDSVVLSDSNLQQQQQQLPDALGDGTGSGSSDDVVDAEQQQQQRTTARQVIAAAVELIEQTTATAADSGDRLLPVQTLLTEVITDKKAAYDAALLKASAERLTERELLEELEQCGLTLLALEGRSPVDTAYACKAARLAVEAAEQDEADALAEREGV
jgi:hypothetical protein